MECPDRDQLQAFQRDNVSEEIATHIENCGACQAALNALPPVTDDLGRQLPQAAREEEFSDDNCDHAIRAVEALGSDPLRIAADFLGSPPGPDVPSTVAPVLRRLGGYELLHAVGEPSG